MLLRTVILLCCLGGLACAQEPGSSPADSQAEQKQDAQKPPAAEPATPAAAPATPAPVSPAAKPPHKKPKVSPPVPHPSTQSATPALPAKLVPAPEQLLLDAVNAALRQAQSDGKRSDLVTLQTRADQLQTQLKATGDRAAVCQQATRILDVLYNSEPPPPAPPPAPALGGDSWLPAVSKLYLVPALVAAILVPLFCLAVFWWGIRQTNLSVYKHFRDAGLL